jgi:[acyl-carrier-protein] S-malonyltransferase
MGKDLCEAYPVARETFDIANEIMGFDIAKLCFEGPEEELRQTRVTQPAIFTHSMAVFRVLKSLGIKFHGALGHSLGEYGALVAADVISFEDGLRLVKARGEFMQSASVGDGPMAAIIGLDYDRVRELCSELEGDLVAEAAIQNGPGQVVVAGHPQAVARIAELAQEAGARRAMILNTSGPFHSSLMAESAGRFEEYLGDFTLCNANCVFIPNTTAEVTSDASTIRRNLVDQVSQTVLWEDSINKAWSEGLDTFIEVGPGKVLFGLIRKIVKPAALHAVGEASQVEKLLADFPEAFSATAEMEA